MTIKEIKNGLEKLSLIGLNTSDALSTIIAYNNSCQLDESYGSVTDADMTLLNCAEDYIDYTRQFYVYNEFGDIAGGNLYKGIQLSVLLYCSHINNLPIYSEWFKSKKITNEEIFNTLKEMCVDYSKGKVISFKIVINTF